MAVHDPRVFVAPSQSRDGTGHMLHTISANSPALPGLLSQVTEGNIRELTTAEYTQWDAGYKTFNSCRGHL